MCGDGYHNMLSEQCDDGNANNDDGCIGACVLNVCSDGVVWVGMEECDDANMIDTDECKNDCTNAICGDGVIQDEVEQCEDLNMVDTDACTNACLDAICGDGILWANMETCDDGNFDDDDACPGSCAPAFCGDGFTQMGAEECDDGNNVDDDACTNTCTSNLVALGTIMLGGSRITNVQTALDTIGEPYSTSNSMFLTPNAADVLIMSNDGGTDNGPDYTAHLNSGKHVLVIGGTQWDPYYNYWATYFSLAPGGPSWHQSQDCMQDWNKNGNHLLTAMLPDTYEFPDQQASYHMMHFNEAGQPGNTTLIGKTCHQSPNNYVLITRKYNNSGTLTYLTFDLGSFASGNMQAQFVVPFLQGYFTWLQSGAP
jgi:cysteine-rich repeat protein